jgi:hypothetical protein
MVALAMQPQQATLIAAAVAAGASLITLVVTVVSKRGAESRAAQRAVIANELKGIGRAIHEVLALTNIQLKVLKETQHPEKYRLAADAAKRVKETRLEVRYTLWGLDEGFRTLARLPDWIGHAKPNPTVAAELFELGRRLGQELDLAVRTAYIKGRTPSWWRTYWVKRRAKELRERYEAFATDTG